ncbi:MAG TPA: DUF1501 domain-containing protein [Tepidisphaeraceae bacterium]|jgi:uncharacterized protein (DUF1501 family)
MQRRRRFLRNASLVALAPLVPTFLEKLALAAGPQADARILVVIQLDGGNDGLNTVIPYADPDYAKNRPTLRIPPKDVLKINDQIGLHPAMRGMADLLHDGRLAIVQGVGYPNPNRSHFQSMRIWQTARPDAADAQTGWIGAAFDNVRERKSAGPDAIYVGESDLPLALVGRRADAAAITGLEDLALHVATPDISPPAKDEGNVKAFVRRTMLSAYGTAHELARGSQSAARTPSSYPDTKLGGQLAAVSQLIKLGGGTRIFYASQGGYDTHAAQLPQHESVLRELSGAVKAFMNDLKAAGLSDRVLLMAFSEFGRRVAENGSLGTDHGAAAPVLLAGGTLKPGLFGDPPGFSQLPHGDLPMSIDFRQIYATLLEDWLNIPSAQVLVGNWAKLPLLTT